MTAPSHRARRGCEPCLYAYIGLQPPLHTVAAFATYGCRPCFNWKSPAGRMAQLADGLTCGARRRRAGAGGGDGDGGGFVTRAPSNGTLAAVFTCAGRMGGSLRARQGRARGKVRGWGLLVMGDSPGFISLARGLPQLQGRVVDTADGGETHVPSLPFPPP